jgi:hypothetical protein
MIVEVHPRARRSRTRNLERMSRRRHQRRPNNISTAGKFRPCVLSSVQPVHVTAIALSFCLTIDWTSACTSVNDTVLTRHTAHRNDSHQV